MRTLIGIVAAVLATAEAWAQEAYYPLREGNTWTYSGEIGGKERTLITSVKGKEKVGDIECFVIESKMANTAKGDIEYVAPGGKGLLRHKYGENLMEPPVEFLRFRGTSGTSPPRSRRWGST